MSLSTTTKNILTSPQWKPATWEDYLAYRDAPIEERVRLFFHQGQLLTDIGSEGIDRASVSNLFPMLFGFWFSQHPEQTADSLGRCLMEKPNTQAASPDLILYIGGIPKERSHYINLTQWRVPDLVGEIADTTLATDLDEKKQLYAALKVPEYWVINIRGKQTIAFRLQENGKYQQCYESVALPGLPISLLEQTLERLSEGTNVSAALWFSQQIAQ